MSKKAKTVLFVIATSVVMMAFIYGVSLLISLAITLVAGGVITKQMEKFVFPLSLAFALVLNFWLSSKVLKFLDKKIGFAKHFDALGFGRGQKKQ